MKFWDSVIDDDDDVDDDKVGDLERVGEEAEGESEESRIKREVADGAARWFLKMFGGAEW